MKYFIGLIIFFSLTAQAAQRTLILELVQLVDSTVSSRVAIYTYDKDIKDPFGHKGPYELEINGQVLPVKSDFLSKLVYLKKSFQSDERTETIEGISVGPICAMAGSALGRELYVLYNTYEKDNIYNIVKQEMRPVLSYADNCIYRNEMRPKSRFAHEAASIAFGMLDAAKDVTPKNK